MLIKNYRPTILFQLLVALLLLVFILGRIPFTATSKDTTSDDFSINRERYRALNAQILELKDSWKQTFDQGLKKTSDEELLYLQDEILHTDQKIEALKNKQQALIKEMAQEGDPLAIRDYAEKLIREQNYTYALSLLNVAATYGDPISMKMLSRLYTHQMPRINQNKEEGAKWDYLAEYFWNSELATASLLKDRCSHSVFYENRGYSDEEKKSGLQLARDWLHRRKISQNKSPDTH